MFTEMWLWEAWPSSLPAVWYSYAQMKIHSLETMFLPLTLSAPAVLANSGSQPQVFWAALPQFSP